jgi:hypothetical protein
LQRKSKKVVGMDYDGVFNRLIPPMQWMMNRLRPDDIWERSHLGKLRSFILKVYSYLPFILDGRIVDKTSRNVYIISGRIIKRSDAKKLLEKYGFRFFFFRPHYKIGEFEWKLRMCRLLGVTEFYDDRPYIVERLRKEGIDARLNAR